MTDKRFTRKTVMGAAGVLLLFVLGIGGGLLISRYLFEGEQQVAVPRLSEVAVPPDELGTQDLASRPPVGLSPVPPDTKHPSSSVEKASGEQHMKVVWAEPYPAPHFALKDQDGNQVSLKDFSGKVVVMNFIYTNCKTICPIETQELKQLQDALRPSVRKEVRLLSVTIDPKRDTPAVLKQYGQRHGIDFGAWKFLTGSEETIRKTLEAYRVPVRVERLPGSAPGDYELGHGNPIYLIDQWGRVRKRTAPTMLVQIGRTAIEHLIKEGARH